MKTSLKIATVILLLFLAGNNSIYSQRGMRDTRDSIRMERPGRSREFSHMRGNICCCNGYGMGNGFRNKRRNMSHGRMGMGPIIGDSLGFGLPGQRRLIERIPDLTDKQKKEIADIGQNQMNEMKKLREDMFTKMKSMRESNRNMILNLLTDEQKKYVESEAGRKELVAPIPK
jgi:hypothetical protein